MMVDPPQSPVARRRRRDALLLGLGALLLVLAGLTWWAWDATNREVRAQVLAGLPPFPSQQSAGGVRRARPDAGVAVPVMSPQAKDRFAAFVAAPAENVAVVQVNALLHTPFAARLKACLPKGFDELADAGGALGFDPFKDLDRVALLPTGVALSGAFDSRLASRLAAQQGGQGSRRYRDAEVFDTSEGGCVAQVGSLVMLGAAGGCEGLVDRALDTPPATPEAAAALDSDLYARSDLSALRAQTQHDPQLAPLASALKQVTLRANVWDEVALSVEGVPADGKARTADLIGGLVSMSVDTSRAQLGEDPAWAALLEKAQVTANGGVVRVDLALPTQALLDHLQFPCPGRDGGVSAP